MEKLVMSLRSTTPEASEEDILTVMRWAEGVELGHTIFESVIDGEVEISVVDGECVFSITPKGRRMLEKDMLENMINSQTDIVQ